MCKNLLKNFFAVYLLFIWLAPLYSAKLVIDNFDNNNQYNLSHTNDLGGYTDDDSTLISDTVQSNFLRLSWNSNNNTYFYSVLDSSNGLDVSFCNYLQIIIRKKNGDENFFIKISDLDNNKSQTAIKYFNPIATDTNNFSTYLIPLSFFPYVDLSQLKVLTLLFSVPFPSLESTATIDIDDIAFLSTNYQYSPGTISPLLIADFEDSLWHTKQGGYFAIESDTNSFVKPAYSNSVVTGVNYTPYGKFCLEWEYNIYDGEHGYSACYFTLAPDGYYPDISDYDKIRFYIKSPNYNPYYKFYINDKWGNSAERVFAAESYWKKVEFNIKDMASQANVDLRNFSSFVFVIKQPGISDKLYIDDVYLISTQQDTESVFVPGENLIEFFSLDSRKILSEYDTINYSFKLRQDAEIKVSLYSPAGEELINFCNNKFLANRLVQGRIENLSSLENGVYVLQIKAQIDNEEDIINKLILITR